jgi:hypothetical protein
MNLDELKRFKAKYTVQGECWIWHGSKVGSRNTDCFYGQFWASKKTWLAHRVSYEHFNGPIPDGWTVDHLCRTTLCVNPAHLQAVTLRENIMRGTGQTAIDSRKTHCPQGHLLERLNEKRRFCRTCHHASDARWRAKQRGKHD